jgi:hypothetical protein
LVPHSVRRTCAVLLRHTTLTPSPPSTSLASRFQRHYDDFDAHFDRKTVGEQPVLCFGISGAGKSTFLARLLSSKSPSEFCAGNIESKSKTTVEGGIMIGHTVSSTTIVPKRYTVGGRIGIYDMPSFRDNDDVRCGRVVHRVFAFLVILCASLVTQAHASSPPRMSMAAGQKHHHQRKSKRSSRVLPRPLVPCLTTPLQPR